MNTKYRHFYDISLPIHPGMITYPGNTQVAFAPLQSSTSYLTELTLGTHTGTHIDAARHAFENGDSVDTIALEKLIGPCRVLDLTHVEHAITKGDLVPFSIETGERILVKTNNSARGFEKFYADYIFLSSEAAEFLAERGVILLGIDALSVKERGSKDNSPHTTLLKREIAIIEGLDLSGIKSGDYQLVALPLRLVGLDGSPARVVLLQE